MPLLDIPDPVLRQLGTWACLLGIAVVLWLVGVWVRTGARERLAEGESQPSGYSGVIAARRVERSWGATLWSPRRRRTRGRLDLAQGWVSFTRAGRVEPDWRVPATSLRLARETSRAWRAPLVMHGPGVEGVRLEVTLGERVGLAEVLGGKEAVEPYVVDLLDAMGRAGASVPGSRG